MIIKKIDVQILKKPLLQPFRIATGQHDYLENVFLKITFTDGISGFGEAAIAPHITGETVQRTKENLKQWGKRIVGKDVSDYFSLSAHLKERLVNNQSAIAAVEMALLDALTKKWKIPLWKFFGNSIKPVQSDITIVVGTLEDSVANARMFYKQGFRVFKIKIGKDEDLDFHRVCAVAKETHYAPFILDANQGFNDQQILKFIRRLKQANLQPVLLEQPVAKNDREGLKRVARISKIPVCADESASSLKDVLDLIHLKAVQVVNIKLMKTGFLESREIAMVCRANGIKLMMGGMMESSLAMTAAAHFVCGLGCFDFIDIDTPFFIKDEVKKNPFLNAQGVYDLRKVSSGIGIQAGVPTIKKTRSGRPSSTTTLKTQ